MDKYSNSCEIIPYLITKSAMYTIICSIVSYHPIIQSIAELKINLLRFNIGICIRISSLYLFPRP